MRHLPTAVLIVLAVLVSGCASRSPIAPTATSGAQAQRRPAPWPAWTPDDTLRFTRIVHRHGCAPPNTTPERLADLHAHLGPLDPIDALAALTALHDRPDALNLLNTHTPQPPCALTRDRLAASLQPALAALALRVTDLTSTRLDPPATPSPKTRAYLDAAAALLCPSDATPTPRAEILRTHGFTPATFARRP